MFRQVTDYSSPKPVDPLWHSADGFLTIRCRCGRVEVERLGDFASKRLLDKKLKIYEMIARLRCKRCKRRPAFAEVTRWASGNRR